MLDNFMDTKTFSGTGVTDFPAGFRNGSVYNKGTTAIQIIVDFGGGNFIISLDPGMIYNFEESVKTYSNVRIQAGTNQIDAVFHY
ncbi:MAG: hypothetical protein SFU27_02600 [Thermonemataceae bacterium]|nr:hypothetical protein [Thermonemataceae bacterium]